MQNRLVFPVASLQPPAMPDPEATASRRRADYVLLHQLAYIADRPNGTTAQGFMLSGQAVQVSFWLVDPPGLSHLCIHCPGLNELDYAEEPTIVCSEKDIAIFQIRFSSSGPNINQVHRGKRQYFVYKADHERPSLDPLPVPSPLCSGDDVFGLLPNSDGEGGFHIAALRYRELAKGIYDLHTFSSKTWTWRTQLAQLPQAKVAFPCHKAHKVIIVDGNTLGFVDLWDGILCCRVDDESPVLPLHHIRLPPPMHINKDMLNMSLGIRDVICINGVIKFIEIANREILVPCEQSRDLSHNAILRDEDLDELANNMVDTKDLIAYDGWVAVTWNRRTGSDYWLKDCEVDVNDVKVRTPRHLDLLPQLSSDHSGKLIWNKNLLISAPSFSLQDGDVVYLMCRFEIMDRTAWVLAINTRKKTLEGLSSSMGRMLFFRTFWPYALSEHMNMAPRNHKVGCRVKERDDAKAAPIDTTIHVHGLDAWFTEAHLMNLFTLFGELRSLNFPANQQYASIRYVTRECAEEAILRMNGNQFCGQKLAVSWASDTQDKQPLKHLQAHANQCDGDADRYSQFHGYYQTQLKLTKPSNSGSSSDHQDVRGNKKMKLNL